MNARLSPLPEITRASWVMVGILGFVWGSTFMVIEIALTGVTPFWLATFRLTIAAMVMAVFWGREGFRMGTDPGNRPHPLSLIWAGAVSSGIPFLLLNWGQQYVTSGFAGTSMAAVPLVVLPMAHFMVAGERLSLRSVIGVTLGFFGVFLLVGQDALHSSGADLEVWGRLACLTVAFCYALNSITVRRIPPINSTALTTIMMASGALITLPFSIAAEGAPGLPPLKAFVALIFLGVISTAAMNQLRVLVIRSAGPTFMTLVNYQVPVWSVVLGALVLSEPLPPSLLIALALILGGMAISQWPVVRRIFVRG
ncbi:DMT family transporter [Celeribacter neptunius]|uniref:Permease of the drug/metabolite transporter (DMT) superfamily n=1 Tax=Celeribacter neptunius TaxID=588602 RepID=A0A1I3J436_9RHOB|nr:DMT family transporter [Celeribacter neptunius]SFI55032.1 Permease of the drug/metabolite transporter (DMT) superfamily [Celeribacter neptunius]